MTKSTAERTDYPVLPFIDGRLAETHDGSMLEVINPSNGKCCTRIPSGSSANVTRAVASARRAFNAGWSEFAPSHRKMALHRFADRIAQESTKLDALDAEEMGKPVGEGFGGALAAAELMRFYAEAVDKVSGDVYASDQSSIVMQRLVPRGVVAAIVPWNFPTCVSVLKMAPALAAGNSVVLKPSELSSRSAIQLAQLAVEAGVPAGVLNVIPGTGESVGRALALHPDVDMMTFTGSTEVGKRIVQYAGQSNMKVVVAECGGKSPQIVFDDDVNLDAACETIARSVLTNQGQICSLGSRVLVEHSIESLVVERIAAHMQGIVMGDALDPTTTFGPLASAKQCSTVMQYIDSGRAAGARCVVGGNRALRETGGFFVEPTVFTNVSPSSRIAQEEIFGPVLSIIPFKGEDEAVQIANGTVYGLAAYVWTADLSRGMRMAKQIRSSVWINAAASAGEGAGYAAAIEPYGQSGMGVEGGVAGMQSYLRRQLVWVNHGR